MYRSRGLIITDRYEGDRKFLFFFGSYGETKVLAFGASLEDALEEATEALSVYAPGHILSHDSSELQDLVAEAAEEHDLDLAEDNQALEALDLATVDLTYTEAGYLASYEWTVTEDPTRAQILAAGDREVAA